jgi:hypothetical protein
MVAYALGRAGWQVMAWRRRHLSTLEFIGEGSYAQVFRVKSYGLFNHGTEPLAYKAYLDLGASGAGADAELVIEFRADLANTNNVVCHELDTYFAWPRELVKDEDTRLACGFLMLLAEPEFFWTGGSLADKPRTMEWLVVDADYLQDAGVSLPDVTVSDRLVLMTQLAFALALLHNQGWVFGDLSFKNILFRLDPPRILLLDCDGTAGLGDPRQDGKHTTFWEPPEYADGQGQLGQNLRTDVYKLGLAIVRCLTPGPGAASTGDVGRLHNVLDAEGIELVTRALSDDPDQRPRSAKEIFAYLRKVTEPRLVPPKIGYAELLTPIVLMAPTGQEARVVWQVEGATEVSVLVGDKPPNGYTVIAEDYPAGCAFPVPESGKVTVVATNRFGADRRVIGDVTLFEIPAFNANLGQLPKPEFPALAAFGVQAPTTPLPGLANALPGTPAIAVPGTAIPVIPVPVVGIPSIGGLLVGAVLGIARSVLRLIGGAGRLLLQSRRRLAGLRIPSKWKSHGKALPVAAWRREPGTPRGRAAGRHHRRARQVRRDGRRAAHDRRGRDSIDVLRGPQRCGRQRRLVDRARAGLGHRDP